MASHKSAVKETRKSRARRNRNRAHRSELRTTLKTTRATIASDKGGAAKAVTEASSVLDRKASKGLIHRNAAARIKSRLARQAHRAGAK